MNTVTTTRIAKRPLGDGEGVQSRRQQPTALSINPEICSIYSYATQYITWYMSTSIIRVYIKICLLCYMLACTDAMDDVRTTYVRAHTRTDAHDCTRAPLSAHGPVYTRAWCAHARQRVSAHGWLCPWVLVVAHDGVPTRSAGSPRCSPTDRFFYY